MFKNKRCAFILLFPQLAISAFFFLWPACQAIFQSLYQSTPFSNASLFVGFKNFIALFQSAPYLFSLGITLIFCFLVTLITLSLGLFMAYLVHTVSFGKRTYKALFTWPYAIAPAVAALLWRFIFTPSIGWVASIFHSLGLDWNYLIHPKQAFSMVVFVSCWQQFSYNFLFFFAGLQSIPRSLLDAASMDGANSRQQFWQIIIPLLSPTTFFLFVVNLIYAFFDTFGVIQIMTQGGPARMTSTLVYKVYVDGFMGLDFGGSAAQSVILMVIISLLMLFQFYYIEKKVHY